MAKYIKGNISYQPVVEQINRKFTVKKNTCSQGMSVGPVKTVNQGWMGGATRTTNRGALGIVSKNYLVIRENARSSAVSRDELASRELFAEVTRGTNHIMTDLSQITRVQQMWLTAKDDSTKTVNGKRADGYTIKGWVFAVQYAGKQDDESYNLNTFPANFDA